METAITKTAADVTIIIPAKDEERNIVLCLEAVGRQKTRFSFGVLVIDSGSTDRTAEEARRFPYVQVISIPPESFGHGRTRNLGARRAQGRFLIFLNADAIPADEFWLQNLVEPLETADFQAPAGVFSRHLPKTDCFLYMARDLGSAMPNESRRITTANGKLRLMLFSTVSAAMRKETWEQFPFKDDIIIAEDQEWGGRLLDAGRVILYNARSLVIHSHNYSSRRLRESKEKIGRAVKPFKSRGLNIFAGFFLAAGGALVKLIGDWYYIFLAAPGPLSFKRRIRETGISLSARFHSFAGRYQGWLHD